MKSKFWVVDNGEERKASYKDFKYWYDNFCASVMDKSGNVLDKGKISIRKVNLIYNGFGIGIAGRN
jgi:hypothetical protein